MHLKAGPRNAQIISCDLLIFYSQFVLLHLPTNMTISYLIQRILMKKNTNITCVWHGKCFLVFGWNNFLYIFSLRNTFLRNKENDFSNESVEKTSCISDM